MSRKITIVGGGLAGAEAAYQAAKRGLEVDLHEMRPQMMTEAHQSGLLGEMVCSNSLGSEEATSASGLLKRELRLLDSFFLRHAERARVPAGGSLSVDRLSLAADLSAALEALPGVRVIRGEVTQLPAGDGPLLIASGPLTSPALAQALSGLTLRKHLYFYDATCPLLRAESIDFSRLFAASRYEKGEADFWNIPLERGQYETFSAELARGETAEVHEFEKKVFFDACLPVEEIARSGPQSLAFGPLKPVGLVDPRSGARPFAVVQLRQDDLKKNFYQLVGFQTRLKHGEQKRIFRTLPGLERAEFERFGRMHRNTYINAPLILDGFSRCKLDRRVYFAGQVSGVEGYVESVASGLLCGLFAARDALGLEQAGLPETTACGALLGYIARADWRDFRPTKFTFGLLPDAGAESRDKKKKKELKAERACQALEQWIKKAAI
ncbi:MAG: methylenetetrahydrofolate--tRNA-(uracil(54)-C(5))-methyltransferase (FADH(2)-oxidizing) TrmFO [Acidobacteria bacterium]|nr:methylenetetrahydrofolate--tRNA-(uracil(54)-C(5))-methyltransferase (FADH(2)-oxidizing) TrmFO [Acidobacteriota bacterium]